MSCMGGWCTLRERCSEYGDTSDDSPVERLCPAGLDGVVAGLGEAVTLVRMDRRGNEIGRWAAAAPAHFARAQSQTGGAL